MIKFPRHRTGKDGETYWAWAGCLFGTLPEGMELSWGQEGCNVTVPGGLQLKKGANMVLLPTPTLKYVVLSVTPSQELLQNPAVTAVFGGGLYGQADLTKGLYLKVVCKEETTVETLATLHLLSDR